MLKYRDPNHNTTNKKSIITGMFDLTEMINSIQPYISENVTDLLSAEKLQYINNTLHLNKQIHYKSHNGDFIWPREYPVHVNNALESDTLILIDKLSGVLDLNNWDLSDCIAIPKLASTLNNQCKEVRVDKGDTKNKKSLFATFSSFNGIEHIDLSTGDLQNVEDLDFTFSFTESLKEVKFKEQDLPNLKTVSSTFTFSGNKDSEILDLTMLHVSNIKYADCMFSNSGFKEIDLRGWTFTDDCFFNKFANNANNLLIFNGVQLQEDWAEKTLYTSGKDGTKVCIDIIRNPGKYEPYLVK